MSFIAECMNDLCSGNGKRPNTKYGAMFIADEETEQQNPNRSLYSHEGRVEGRVVSINIEPGLVSPDGYKSTLQRSIFSASIVNPWRSATLDFGISYHTVNVDGLPDDAHGAARKTVTLTNPLVVSQTERRSNWTEISIRRANADECVRLAQYQQYMYYPAHVKEALDVIRKSGMQREREAHRAAVASTQLFKEWHLSGRAEGKNIVTEAMRTPLPPSLPPVEDDLAAAYACEREWRELRSKKFAELCTSEDGGIIGEIRELYVSCWEGYCRQQSRTHLEFLLPRAASERISVRGLYGANYASVRVNMLPHRMHYDERERQKHCDSYSYYN